MATGQQRRPCRHSPGHVDRTLSLFGGVFLCFLGAAGGPLRHRTGAPPLGTALRQGPGAAALSSRRVGTGDGAGDDPQAATGPAQPQCSWAGPFVERVSAHFPSDARATGATDVGRECPARHHRVACGTLSVWWGLPRGIAAQPGLAHDPHEDIALDGISTYTYSHLHP